LSSKQSIAELAYHLWNARGRPHGSEEEDWLEAERRLAAPKEADREGGGPEGALDASLNLDTSLKDTLPTRGRAASRSPELPSSNVRNRPTAGDKSSAPGRRSRTEAKSTREISNPPVDETDDGPKTAPHDIGEG
jgi:hypothetical protein